MGLLDGWNQYIQVINVRFPSFDPLNPPFVPSTCSGTEARAQGQNVQYRLIANFQGVGGFDSALRPFESALRPFDMLRDRSASSGTKKSDIDYQ